MQKPRLANLPRLTDWMLVGVLLCLTVLLLAPQQIPVSLYKLSLVALAGVAGYYLDRSVFPYARPEAYLCIDWRQGTDEAEYQVDYEVVEGYQRVFAAALIRRAIIIGAAMVAVGLGA